MKTIPICNVCGLFHELLLFSSLKRQQHGTEKELTLQSDWFKGAPSLQHNSASWWWGLVTMRVTSRP